MNKDEIMEVLSEKSISDRCIYCKSEIKRGFYAEDNIGRKIMFPKILTKNFCNNQKEIPIHFKCVKPFLFNILKEGGEIDATKENTRILIRY